MARISGVDIPRDKQVGISLTYIYGIGRTIAIDICNATGIDATTRVRDVLALTLAGPTATGGRVRHGSYFFLPAMVFLGPLRVRALVWVR